MGNQLCFLFTVTSPKACIWPLAIFPDTSLRSLWDGTSNQESERFIDSATNSSTISAVHLHSLWDLMNLRAKLYVAESAVSIHPEGYEMLLVNAGYLEKRSSAGIEEYKTALWFTLHVVIVRNSPIKCLLRVKYLQCVQAWPVWILETGRANALFISPGFQHMLFGPLIKDLSVSRCV